MKTKNTMNPMKNFSTFGRVLNVLPFKLKIMKNWLLFLLKTALGVAAMFFFVICTICRYPECPSTLQKQGIEMLR
jgi:hypothetical protein